MINLPKIVSLPLRMKWIFLALISSFFLGLYDISKKRSLEGNNVLMVLFLNTLFCAIIFIPLIIASHLCRMEGFCTSFEQSQFYVPEGNLITHITVFIKAIIVLVSWVLGYYGLKNMPITLAGPINATRPVLVLLGAVTLFGERLNVWQWLGVALAIVSFYLLSHTGKREGISFVRNKWVWCCMGGTFMGAVSGLYDKWLMADLSPVFVLSWYVVYQAFIMGILVWVLHKRHNNNRISFTWRWSILLISVCLSIADFVYFTSLSIDGSLISVISMLRRCSVLVSFAYGAWVLKEKNIRAKSVDLALILMGLAFLVAGSV